MYQININDATKAYLKKHVEEKKRAQEKVKETEDGGGDGTTAVAETESSKPVPDESDKATGDSVDKDSEYNTKKFGIVTDEDSEADKDIAEKINSMIEEWLKTRPPPPPPPPPPVQPSADSSGVDIMKTGKSSAIRVSFFPLNIDLLPMQDNCIALNIDSLPVQILMIRMMLTLIKGQLMKLKDQKLALLIGGRIKNVIRTNGTKILKGMNVNANVKELGGTEKGTERRIISIEKQKSISGIASKSGNLGRERKSISDRMKRKRRKIENVTAEGIS